MWTSLEPRTHKKICVAPTCNFSTGYAETGGSWDIVGQPAKSKYQALGSREILSQKDRERKRELVDVHLWPLGVQEQGFEPAHTHTHAYTAQ